MYGGIARAVVSLIIRTGDAWRPFRHERHFSEASSFQIGVSRGRRMAFSGRLARVLQRLHSTSSQASPPLRHCPIVGDGCAGPPCGSTKLPLCPVSFLSGLLSRFLGAHLRAHNATAPDYLSALCAHTRHSRPALRGFAMPLGLEVGNGWRLHPFGQCDHRNESRQAGLIPGSGVWSCLNA